MKDDDGRKILMKRREESSIESGTLSNDDDWRIVLMKRKEKHDSKVSEGEGMEI